MTSPSLVSATPIYLGDTAATSHAVPMPAVRPDGDTYIAILTRRGTGAINAPAGWLNGPGPFTETTSSTHITYVFYKTGASEPASYSFTMSTSQRIVATVLQVRGGAATSPLEAGAIKAEQTTGYLFAPRATPAGPDRLAIQWATGNVSAGNDKIRTDQGLDVAGSLAVTSSGLTMGLKVAPAPVSGDMPGLRMANLGDALQVSGVTIFVKPAVTTRPSRNPKRGPGIVRGLVAPSLTSEGRLWTFPGQRYTGDAYFRKPLSSTTVDPNATQLLSDFWAFGGATTGIRTMSDDFSYSVFWVHNSTDNYSVNAPGCNMHGRTIRWNPLWNVPAPADPLADKQFILYDAATGEEINGWQVTVDHTNKVINATHCNRLDTANDPSVYGSTPLDWRTGNARYNQSRGSALGYGAGLVFPEEVERGVIGHALSLCVRAPSAAFVPPAGGSDGPWEDAKLPMGLRLGIVCTDAEMYDALDRVPNDVPDPVATKRSALAYFQCWRTYGAVVTDHAGSAHVQFEQSNTAAAYWQRLGWSPHTTCSDGKKYPSQILDLLCPANSPRLQAFAP